jgi:hypothetical protein
MLVVQLPRRSTHLDILKELPKHSKREAFLTLCASPASKLLRHDSLLFGLQY